jgi:hypothetical protein
MYKQYEQRTVRSCRRRRRRRCRRRHTHTTKSRPSATIIMRVAVVQAARNGMKRGAGAEPSAATSTQSVLGRVCKRRYDLVRKIMIIIRIIL